MEVEVQEEGLLVGLHQVLAELLRIVNWRM